MTRVDSRFLDPAVRTVIIDIALLHDTFTEDSYRSAVTITARRMGCTCQVDVYFDGTVAPNGHPVMHIAHDPWCYLIRLGMRRWN